MLGQNNKWSMHFIQGSNNGGVAYAGITNNWDEVSRIK